jgi:hypothetical protein|tara:strand:+ start:173 stop:298 length:126 start_codon:yes stop_codon:yes gene_type:complete
MQVRQVLLILRTNFIGGDTYFECGWCKGFARADLADEIGLK